MTPPAAKTTKAKQGGPASAREIVRAETMLELLADRNRLRILCALVRRRQLSVGEICAEADLNQSTVVHHLSYLRAGGLVESKRSKHNVYWITPGSPIKPVFKAVGLAC